MVDLIYETLVKDGFMSRSSSTAKTAELWMATFGYSESEAWIAHGVTDPSQAARLKHLGFNHRMASEGSLTVIHRMHMGDAPLHAVISHIIDDVESCTNIFELCDTLNRWPLPLTSSSHITNELPRFVFNKDRFDIIPANKFHPVACTRIGSLIDLRLVHDDDGFFIEILNDGPYFKHLRRVYPKHRMKE